MSRIQKITILALVTSCIAIAVSLLPLINDIFFYSKEYHPCEFEVISEGLTDKGIELTVTVPPESVYYCPGATYQKSNGTISFSVVRSQIDTKATVDVAAERKPDGSLVLLFPLKDEDIADGRKIELKDSSGRLRGAWSISSEDNKDRQVAVPVD